MFNWLKKKCYPYYPNAATIEEWADITKRMREKRICFWLFNTLPTTLAVWKMQGQDVLMKFKYRYHPKHQYHIIRTGLKPDYYEADERMLHGMFSLLVDYVEEELAWLYYLSHPEVSESGDETGLLALDWQIEANLPDAGDNSHSDNFKEIKELYLWWTVDRPERELQRELMISQFYSNKPPIDTDLTTMEILAARSKEETEETAAFFDTLSDIEEQHWDEDTEMLTRLIRIRGALWT
jgi:hypothetical protein